MKSSPTNFIDRLKKQKEDALDFVIDAYLPLVKGIVKKILETHRTQDVDECINDVFLSVWQNAAQFQGDAADFKKWIGMITKYKAIDRYRQLKKQALRENAEEMMEQQSAFITEQEILVKEQKNELLFALSQLAELDRDIFMMKYYLELSNSDIADALGLTKSAIDNRLYRGKRELAQYKNLKERFI